MKNKYKAGYLSLTSLLLEKRRLHNKSVRKVMCKGRTAKSSGNMTDWGSAGLVVWRGLHGWMFARLMTLSHICFPPWPHVLRVNAEPPRLNTGDPVTNDVLLGLLCIRPQKQIDEHVIMQVGVCLVCGAPCKCACFSIHVGHFSSYLWLTCIKQKPFHVVTFCICLFI